MDHGQPAACFKEHANTMNVSFNFILLSEPARRYTFSPGQLRVKSSSSLSYIRCSACGGSFTCATTPFSPCIICARHYNFNLWHSCPFQPRSLNQMQYELLNALWSASTTYGSWRVAIRLKVQVIFRTFSSNMGTTRAGRLRFMRSSVSYWSHCAAHPMCISLGNFSHPTSASSRFSFMAAK